MRAGRAAASVFPPDPARAARRPLSRGREAMNEPDACPSAPARAPGETHEISRLRRRADFQRAARGRRARLEAFSLQANRRGAPDPLGARVGFTVTKEGRRRGSCAIAFAGVSRSFAPVAQP